MFLLNCFWRSWMEVVERDQSVMILLEQFLSGLGKRLWVVWVLWMGRWPLVAIRHLFKAFRWILQVVFGSLSCSFWSFFRIPNFFLVIIIVPIIVSLGILLVFIFWWHFLLEGQLIGVVTPSHSIPKTSITLSIRYRIFLFVIKVPFTFSLFSSFLLFTLHIGRLNILLTGLLLFLLLLLLLFILSINVIFLLSVESIVIVLFCSMKTVWKLLSRFICIRLVLVWFLLVKTNRHSSLVSLGSLVHFVYFYGSFYCWAYFANKLFASLNFKFTHSNSNRCYKPSLDLISL